MECMKRGLVSYLFGWLVGKVTVWVAGWEEWLEVDGRARYLEAVAGDVGDGRGLRLAGP